MTDEEIKAYHDLQTDGNDKWQSEEGWSEPYTDDSIGVTLRKEHCWAGCIDCYFEHYENCPDADTCVTENYIWKEVK